MARTVPHCFGWTVTHNVVFPRIKSTEND